MNKIDVLNKFKETLKSLEPIYEKINIDGKLNLSEDNIYIAISFISKIYGLNSIFTAEFIKENNLQSLVKKIDEDMIKMQASHYSDKQLFYELINNIYPLLQYRLSQIEYRYSLSDEEQKKLIITLEYQCYLSKLLKYYLEQPSTQEIQKNIKEILSIVNLYTVIEDEDVVALGSEVTFIDTLTNKISKGKIVIDSHADYRNHKLSFKEMYPLLSHKKEEIVPFDYSLSYFIRILDVKNKEKKVSVR